MCDTMVVVPPSGPVWFAKNSDREPGEAQVVEHHPAGPATERRATWVPIPEPAPRAAVVLSRPAWMWGAEMGVNEHGVAIGNEAVFTRLPVAPVGLTGMDLLRLALEQARTADDALERLTGLLARHGQGGRCGFRSAGFRYHNAFVIADRRGAWLLETADRCWAAVRVRGVRTTSNVLTIDAPDRIGPGTLEEARRRGLYRDDRPFSFREVFGRVDMAFLSGGDVRRACSLRTLSAHDGGEGTDLARCMAALRDHGGHDPQRGLRMTAPCAHAGLLPTRTSGQTTGSLIARLGERTEIWATGTSAPCLSVFKPVSFDTDTGPVPVAGKADRDSLFWRSERLHRAVMVRDPEAARAIFEADRAALEAASPADVWERHRVEVDLWARAVLATPTRGPRVARWFWARESAKDGV